MSWRAIGLLLAVLAAAAQAQEPPNRDYTPPFKGEAVFDPRPAKRAAAEAEAARLKTEEEARIKALQVDNPLNALPPPAAPEPAAAPAPTPAPDASDDAMPVAEGYAADGAVAEGYVPPPPPPAVVVPVRSPVEQPRPYGYLVGDTLVQRVQLSVDGRPVELVELPRRDRHGVWIVRRGSSLETRADGTRWLAMEYQIVNASKDVDVISLPKLSLRTTTPEVFIEVPDWPITVGAITASLVRNQGGLVPLQPDRPVPTVALAPIRHRLMQVLAALGVTVALWLGWWRWREWQASRRLPFGRAQAELRGLDAESDAAWRCLHQAFDAAAGRVIQPASLGALFAARPELEAERAAIERFYAASAARFFGGQPQGDSGLAALCARLRKLERGHER
jgi:mxaA protein